jgi:uncharacterized membrane protein YkvA (DUF1232 family)
MFYRHDRRKNSTAPFGARERVMLSRLRDFAHRLKRDSHAIYLASRDPRVPWYVKFLAIAVAAYALSPIDLIPDFIPIIGYVDDFIIVPLGIWLVISLSPDDVMAEYRAEAAEAQLRPTSTGGMIAIILLWIMSASALAWVGYRYWNRL